MKIPPMRIVIPLFLLLAAGIAAWIFLSSRDGKSSELHATGIIDGTEVNLSSKVAGKISRVECNEGDVVRDGQVVIALESEDVKAAVELARAGVERAGAGIKAAEASVENGKANILASEAEARSAESDIENAGARLEESRRQAERRKELFSRNLISMESRDQVVTEYWANAASFASTKERLDAARARTEAAASQLKAAVSQLSASRAALKEAEANLAVYRSKLDDMTIRTPVTGTVIFKSLEKGETVGPGVAILTVVDLGHLYARVDLDETKIGRVVLNGPARVTVEGAPGKVFGGRVIEVGRHGEFATQRDVVRGREDIRTFRVKVRVDDPSGTLKPGMTVDVGFPGKT